LIVGPVGCLLNQNAFHAVKAGRAQSDLAAPGERPPPMRGCAARFSW
jgi:hypothetical protein